MNQLKKVSILTGGGGACSKGLKNGVNIIDPKN